jgi:hypothetical protein
MLASEYLVDDMAEVVRSGAFADAVSQRLAGQGISVPAGAIEPARSRASPPHSTVT